MDTLVTMVSVLWLPLLFIFALISWVIYINQKSDERLKQEFLDFQNLVKLLAKHSTGTNIPALDSGYSTVQRVIQAHMALNLLLDAFRSETTVNTKGIKAVDDSLPVSVSVTIRSGRSYLESTFDFEYKHFYSVMFSKEIQPLYEKYGIDIDVKTWETA